MANSYVWCEQLKAHLELARQVASRLPAGERLEVEKLNEVLTLMGEVKGTFLLMCELHGFEIKEKS